MGSRNRYGISEAAAAAVALLVALAVAVLGFSIYYRNVQTSQAAFEKESGEQAVKMSERLTLVYWTPGGTVYLANDGPDPVTVVQIYVDGNLRWSGSLTIQPRQIATINLSPGTALAVKTSSGALHVLKKD